MVAARPFFSGSPGCVRSSACTWLFSSQHNTSACSGGDRYKPTMSSSFSANFGSRETLNVSTKCGFSPLARQIRSTGIADARLGGQRARAPVGSRFGLVLCRQAHDLGRINTPLASRARQIGFDRRQPTFGKRSRQRPT